MKEYLFYILDPNNNQVMGVISEYGGNILYDGLIALDVFDSFQNTYIKQLQPYHDSPSRLLSKALLSEHFGKVEVTKDYVTALCHAMGKTKKAVSKKQEWA